MGNQSATAKNIVKATACFYFLSLVSILPVKFAEKGKRSDKYIPSRYNLR